MSERIGFEEVIIFMIESISMIFKVVSLDSLEFKIIANSHFDKNSLLVHSKYILFQFAREFR